MPEPNLQKLYGFITGTKFDAGKLDIGDYDTFRIKMQQADSRRKLYDFLSRQSVGAKRADFGTFSEFEDKVKLEPFAPPVAPGFVSPEPESKLERVISDIDKYIGEQVLAPAALKAKKAIGGLMPEGLRRATGFEMTPLQLKKAEEPGAPALPITKLGPTAAQIEASPAPGIVKKAAAAGLGVTEAIQGLTTAENLALATTLGGAPKAIQAVGSAGFAALMASGLPEVWQAFKEAKTPTEKIRLATHGLTSLFFTGAAAKHAVTGGKGAIEEYKIGKQRPKALPELEEAARVTTEISEAAAKRKTAEPVTAEELQQKAQTDLAALSEREATGLHPNDAKNLSFLRANIDKTPELERAYRTRVEPPETVQKFRQEKEAKRAESEQKIIEQKAEAEQARIGREQAEAKIKAEEEASLGTPDLQIGSIAERLAGAESNVAFADLAVAERNRIRAEASKEYTNRLRTISRELELTNEDLAGAKNRGKRQTQAREILRQQLVDEKNAQQIKPAETPSPVPETTPAETQLTTRPLELAPEDIETIPPRPPAGLPAPAEVSRGKLRAPAAGELPGVTKTATPAAEARRGEYVGEIPETRIPAAGRTQEHRAQPEMFRGEVAAKLEEKYPGKVKFFKEPILDAGDEVTIQGRKGTFTVTKPVIDGRTQLKGPGGNVFAIPTEKVRPVAKPELPPELAGLKTGDKVNLQGKGVTEYKFVRALPSGKILLQGEKGNKFAVNPALILTKKAPITAETKLRSSKISTSASTEQTGQPATGRAITEEGPKPVAARPAETARVAPIKPEIAGQRPSEQLRQAQKIYDEIPKTEGWQDRVKTELENAGYPNNIVKFLSEPERRTRPSLQTAKTRTPPEIDADILNRVMELEQKGATKAEMDSDPILQALDKESLEAYAGNISYATTREGRIERAVPPLPELKTKVDAISDAARRNQIAQARYNRGRTEVLAEIQSLEKKGVIVKVDPSTGGYQISIRDPQALTESTKAAIERIKQAEIDKGSYKPEMISTDLQIAVAPGAEALKGLSLPEGDLTAKVLETIKRKEQAKKTQIVFDKLKAAHKDALTDYYFNRNAPEEGTALLGRTKEGLETEVLIRRQPSVKGPGIISPEAQKQIAGLKAVDKAQIDTGTALLENAPSREAWNDQMIAKHGKQIESKLDEIHAAAKYIQENKFVEIRNIAQAIPETAAKKGFEFIRTKLSAEDQAKFDAVLDDIKATDIEILGRANDFGSVIAGTAKQYANYVEFGYWTLKALGRAGANKAAWAAEMVKSMGEKIRPFLDDLWKKINADGYKPGQQFTDADLPKFNANTVRPKIERVKENLPDDNPLPITKDAKRPTPFIGAYVEPVVRTIERVSPKVATGFRQAIDYWERQEGTGNSFILPLARALRFKPTALNRLDEISRTDGASMWDNWHEWLKKPGTVPRDLTKVEKQAIDIYQKLLDERVKVLTEAGRENVEQVAFKRVPSFDLLDAIRSEGGAVWNTLVKELARLNDLPVEKVEGYLKRYRLEKFDEFPTHIRVGKGKFADTVPVLATQGLSALRALNRDTSRLAGVTKVFGDNYNSTFKEIRKQLPANFQADFDLARDAYFGVRRLENSRSLGKRLLLNLAQPVVRTALLARAAFYQPTQALATARLTTGTTLLRGLTDLAKKGTKAELEAINAYAPTILDLAWQKGQRIEDLGRILSELGGNVSLLKPAIEMTDLGITAGFRRFALDIKERGGRLKAREKNTLEVLNFTPEQINLIDKRGFEGYKDADVLYSAVINRGRKAVTFTGLKGPERTKFQLNPLISSLIQFQGFNIGQMQQAAGVVRNLSNRVDAMRTAKTPEEKSAAQAQLGSAIKQAAILFGATMTAAEANNFMRALINGQDLDRPEDWKRLFEDLVETGWLPFVREFVLGFVSDPSKIILPNSIWHELIDAWVGKGKYKDYEWWERAALFLDRYAAKPYTQAYEMQKNMLIASSLLEGNPTLKTATSYYWDFLKDEDEFKESERKGYNEAQAAMREIVNAVKESPHGQFGEMTRKKVREGVAKAIRAKGLELVAQGKEPLEAEEEARKRIRMGLLNRRTLSKFYKEDTGAFEIGKKKFNREQLDEALRGGKYVSALLSYDRLLSELADSL